MSKEPKISVITACFNAEQTIEQTIQSVISQTYDNIEYIIIDGASTDGTMEIVSKYADQIDKIISEPDKGIYDAFNKGARLATGDYIQYLNADDYLAADDAIEGIIQFILSHNSPVLVYGGILMINEITDYKLVRNQIFTINNIAQGQMIPHPATFVQRDILLEMGLFDTQYKIAADFDLICKLYLNYNSSIYHCPQIITNFRIGGLSSDFKNREAVIIEVKHIVEKYFNNKIHETIELSNGDLLKRWIEKQLFERKSIAGVLASKYIKKVALWGTGELAVILYKELTNHHIDVLFYIDNNKQKQGLFMNSIPIMSSDYLLDNQDIDCIVMGFEGKHEETVLEQISSLSLSSRIFIYSWRDLIKEL